jgi:hypothetical protein
MGNAAAALTLGVAWREGGRSGTGGRVSGGGTESDLGLPAELAARKLACGGELLLLGRGTVGRATTGGDALARDGLVDGVIGDLGKVGD